MQSKESGRSVGRRVINLLYLQQTIVLNFTAHIFSQNKAETLEVLAPKVGYEDVVWTGLN